MSDGLTSEGYYAIVTKRLGLRPTNVPTIFHTAFRDTVRVPLPDDMTPEQRAETIEYLKEILGVTDDDDS